MLPARHIPALLLCVLIRALAEVCSTIHIIGYASYAALDTLALRISEGLDR